MSKSWWGGVIRLKIGDGSTSWNDLGYVGSGQYLPLSGGIMTGDITFSSTGSNTLGRIGYDASSYAFEVVGSSALHLQGYSMTLSSSTGTTLGGYSVNVTATNFNMGSGTYTAISAGDKRIQNVATPTTDNDAANKSYVDTVTSEVTSSMESYLPLSGGTLTGDLRFGGTGLLRGESGSGSMTHIYLGSTGGYGGSIYFVTTRYPDDGVCYIYDSAGNSGAAGLYMNQHQIVDVDTITANIIYGAANNDGLLLQAARSNQAYTNTKLFLSDNSVGTWSSTGLFTSETLNAGNVIPNCSDIEDYVSSRLSNYLPGYNPTTHTIDLNLGSSNLNFEDPINFEQGVRCGGYLTVAGGPLYVSGTNYPHIRNAVGTQYVTIGMDASNQLVIYGGTVRPGGDVQQNLGYSNHRWATIYAGNGTIQTSDRSEKSDIHYIKDSTTSVMKTTSLNANTTDTDNKYEYSYDNLLEFIDKLNPVVFSYGKDGIDASLSDNHMDQTQLGLIADDIQDEELFKFVGASIEDDEGNTHLGLKPIPLAVLALSACKNLLQRVKQLESK